LCVVLAAVLVPVSIVGAWGRVQLVDESRFVATLGPLAQDAHVQDLVIDQTQAAIDQRVQYDQLTGSVIDGISGLVFPHPPRRPSACSACLPPMGCATSSTDRSPRSSGPTRSPPSGHPRCATPTARSPAPRAPRTTAW
jgi:hypothetical protein